MPKAERVQIAFLVPSLLYGAYLAVTTGHWALVILSAGSVLVWLVFGNYSKISGEVRFQNNRVFVGKRRLHRFAMFWPADLKDRIFEAAFESLRGPASDAFENLAKRNKWFLGLADQDQLHLPIGTKGHHCLVIGPTGSGKTELLRNLAINFDSDLVAIDFKGGLGLAPLNPVRMLTNQSDEPEDFWNFLANLLDARERALVEGDSPKQLLVMVDELALVLASSQAAQRTIERIVSKGRSLEVVLIAASQTLSGISRTVLANCSLRIAIGAVDAVDLAQLGITQRSANHNPSRGYASLIAEGELTKFWFAPLWKGQEKEMAPADIPASANPLMARFAPMHESIHL